jgi:ABC-type lipoprotein release transport system permease subunit
MKTLMSDSSRSASAGRGTARRLMRQGGTLAAGRILLGIAIAVVASRALQQLLYGIEPTDPITYAIACFALAAVAIAACYVPARRAASVEPYNALRG